jgi:hypothetical protein
MGTETIPRLDGLLKIAVILFFSALFLNLTMTVFDPDFWWHLASGRWMWQNKSLLHEDPFNFAVFPSESSLRRDFVLKQYWLSQLLFYAVYSIAGFKGIVLLRASVFTAMFYTIYRLMRGEGVGRLVSVPLIYLASMAVIKEFSYVGDKPQMWTSLISVILIYVLEHMKRGEKWTYYMLPALMVLWANMHAGFVLGDIIITIYLASAVVFRTGSKSFYVSTALALLLSGLNPKGYMAFLRVFSTMLNIESVRYLENIVESQSIFSHASLAGILKTLPFFSSLLIISLAAFALNIRNSGKMKRELVLLYVLVFLMGLKSIRYIIFFATVASFITAVNLRDVTAAVGRLAPKTMTLKKSFSVLAIVIILVLSADLAARGAGMTSLHKEKPYVNDYGGVVDFMKRTGLKGNIFNDYAVGGYLIWWLYPDIKVFTDGRAISYAGFDLFRHVVDRPQAPLSRYDHTPVYERALESFNMDIAVLPGCDKVSGTTIALSHTLIEDKRWAIVYADAHAIVFMRRTPANSMFINRHSLPDTAGYDNILAMAAAAARNSRHAQMMPGIKLSLAIAYKGKGNRAEALRWINEYLRLRPDDRAAVMLKYRIERM